MQKTLGDVIRKVREHAGLSQRDLARITGMPVGQISMIENGVRLNPTFLTILKLAKGLRVSLDALAAEYACVKHDGEIRLSFMPGEHEYLTLLREIEAAKGEAQRAASRLEALLQNTTPGKKQVKHKKHP